MIMKILRKAQKRAWGFCTNKRCFIFPYPKKETRAHLLKNSALLFYVLILLFFQLYVYHLSPRILGFATNIKATDLYQITNNRRSSSGVSTLRIDYRLERAALAKARDMFSKDYWAHYAPDGSTTPWQFILNSGYAYKFAGENLAKDFNTSVSVVEAWMASPSHRANLINGNYANIGIAVVNGTLLGEETTLVVQMFASPQATVVAKAPEPKPITKEPEEPKPVAVVGPKEEVAISQPAVLTQAESSPLAQVVRAVNPVSSPKTIPLGFGFILMGLFVIDEVAMLKGGLTRSEIRRTGENIAHVAILGLLMVLVWLTKTGGIV